MGLYTGTVKGLSRAPYRAQVEVHLLNLDSGDALSPDEITKIERVKRFLDPRQCAQEISDKRRALRTQQDS